MHKVAVYGTLRHGEGNHHTLEGSKFLGFWRVEGGLYTHGGFPGLSEPIQLEGGGTETVLVEVYEVNDATISRLDRLEGVPYHYERVAIELAKEMLGFYKLDLEGPVFVYKYKVDVKNLIHIEGGDWVKWRKERASN